MTKFRIPLDDEELELIEDALRHYAKQAVGDVVERAKALADKVADADEGLAHG
jgi:hypothetical protein